jgi:hypothetical protein
VIPGQPPAGPVICRKHRPDLATTRPATPRRDA